MINWIKINLFEQQNRYLSDTRNLTKDQISTLLDYSKRLFTNEMYYAVIDKHPHHKHVLISNKLPPVNTYFIQYYQDDKNYNRTQLRQVIDDFTYITSQCGKDGKKLFKRFVKYIQVLRAIELADPKVFNTSDVLEIISSRLAERLHHE